MNTSEKFNPVFTMEFTMDFKVIYGFDLSLCKTFHYFDFFCQGREVESEKLFGLDLELVKTTLREGGG